MQKHIARNAVEPVEMIPGLWRRTLAWAEQAMMCEFTAEAGVFVPPHSHPAEQIGFVIAGRIEFEVGGESFIAETGDSYAIPGQVEHSARFLVPTTLIEVFSPPRPELA